jgi:hypothetical protein
MPSLSQLPAELTEEIAGSLCLYCTPTFEPEKFVYSAHRWSKEERLRVKTLASLCLTSKTLSESATRHLYHCPTPEKWWLLARTLITAPGKARHVRDLRFGVFDWPDDNLIPGEVMAYCYQRTETYVPVPACKDFEYELPEYIADYKLGGITHAEGLVHHNDNVSMDIVTSLCPNLKRLEATLCWSDDQDFFTAFCFCTPNSLTALTNLNLREGPGLGFCDLIHLFRAAPNLTSICLYDVSMDYDEGHEETDNHNKGHSKDVPGTLDFVKFLRLQHSAVYTGGLAVMLRTCANLETLEYSSGDPDTGLVQFTAEEANDVILRYAPSLRTFRLDLASFPHDEFGLEEAEEALISRGIDFSYQSWFRQS